MHQASIAGQGVPDLISPAQRATIFRDSRADLITADQRRTIFGKPPASKLASSRSRPLAITPASVLDWSAAPSGAALTQLKELEAERRRLKREVWIRLTFKVAEVTAKIIFELFVLIMGAVLLPPLLHRERGH